MVTFYGKYVSKLDDKGRIVLPAPLKSLLPEDSDMTFVVRKDNFANCLEMYPVDEWEKKATELKSRLDFFNVQHAMFWRAYVHGCTKVTPDSKFGRITISREQLDAIGVIKEVEFVGNGFKIEVWAKGNYEASILSNEDFVAIAGKLPAAR